MPRFRPGGGNNITMAPGGLCRGLRHFRHKQRFAGIPTARIPCTASIVGLFKEHPRTAVMRCSATLACYTIRNKHQQTVIPPVCPNSPSSPTWARPRRGACISSTMGVTDAFSAEVDGRLTEAKVSLQTRAFPVAAGRVWRRRRYADFLPDREQR